jgi:hypothetical protein
MCKPNTRRTTKQKRRPWRVRHDNWEDDVLEDWMCAGAPTPS